MDHDRAKKAGGLREVADEMDAKAKRVAAHMAARASLSAKERCRADLAFMDVLSKHPFWEVVRNSFEYVRDTARLAAEMIEEPAFRPQRAEERYGGEAGVGRWNETNVSREHAIKPRHYE